MSTSTPFHGSAAWQRCTVAAAFAWAGTGMSAPQAQPTCDATCAATGHQYLGQGMALFEAKDPKSAERALQAALFVGLPQAGDRALAHKLLAFVYCTGGERKRCGDAFDEAFAAQPGFALADYEARNSVWRVSYLQSLKRATARAPSSPAKVAVAAPARPEPPEDSNVRLRVEPWASVNVNGKDIGVTPPVTRLKLPPGTHAIRLSNPGFKPVRQVIRVAGNGTVTVQHDFETK